MGEWGKGRLNLDLQLQGLGKGEREIGWDMGGKVVRKRRGRKVENLWHTGVCIVLAAGSEI